MNQINQITNGKKSLKRKAGRRLKKLQGMTLVEIMVVIIIMALIATAVGIAVLPSLERSRVNATRSDATAIQSAVTMYLATNPGGDCPSVEDLTRERILDSSRRVKDAWDRDFTIECSDGDIIVSSSGPDGQNGNDDDIRTTP